MGTPLLRLNEARKRIAAQAAQDAADSMTGMLGMAGVSTPQAQGSTLTAGKTYATREEYLASLKQQKQTPISKEPQTFARKKTVFTQAAL